MKDKQRDALKEYNIDSVGVMMTSDGAVWQFHRGEHTVRIASEVMTPTQHMLEEARAELDQKQLNKQVEADNAKT